MEIRVLIWLLMLIKQQKVNFINLLGRKLFQLTRELSSFAWVALWWTDTATITATTRMSATSVGCADPHRSHWHIDPSSTCRTPVRIGRIVFFQYYVQYLFAMLTNSVKDRTTNHTKIAYSMLHRACWWYGVQGQRDRGFSEAGRSRLWQDVN